MQLTYLLTLLSRKRVRSGYKCNIIIIIIIIINNETWPEIVSGVGVSYLSNVKQPDMTGGYVTRKEPAG